MNINLTLFGQSFSFAVFVLFCMKFVWPAITNAMAERAKKIEEGLAAADRANTDLELAKEKVAQDLKEAKAQAASIIEAANKRANQIVEEAKDTARKEGDRLKIAAQADIEQEVNRAKEDLRKQVSLLALAGAEKILGSTIDAQKNDQLVNNLVAEL